LQCNIPGVSILNCIAQIPLFLRRNTLIAL
jgi:hypothetical protein